MAWLNSGWLFPPCIGGACGRLAIWDGIEWWAEGGSWWPGNWLPEGWVMFNVCCCILPGFPEDNTVTCSPLWAGWWVTVRADGWFDDGWLRWCDAGNGLLGLIKFVCWEVLVGRTLAISVFMIFCEGCWWAAGVCCWIEAGYLAFMGNPEDREDIDGVCLAGCDWWDFW